MLTIILYSIISYCIILCCIILIIFRFTAEMCRWKVHIVPRVTRTGTLRRRSGTNILAHSNRRVIPNPHGGFVPTNELVVGIRSYVWISGGLYFGHQISWIWCLLFFCCTGFGIRSSAGLHARWTSEDDRHDSGWGSLFVVFPFPRQSASHAFTPVFFHRIIRPVHLLRVSLLRVLESNFPGDSL